jgi:hypothetical protein
MLLALHPQITAQTCHDCRQWVFTENHRQLLHRGKPVLRPLDVLTPCDACPKGNEESGHWFDAHLDDLRQLVVLYHRVQATAGTCLASGQRRDVALQRDLSIVHAVVRRLEVGQAVQAALF